MLTTEFAGMTTLVSEARDASPPPCVAGATSNLGVAGPAIMGSGDASFCEVTNRIASRNYVTAADLVRELRDACARETQKGFCQRTGANQGTVSMVLSGIRPMTPAIANALGAMSETVFYRVGKKNV